MQLRKWLKRNSHPDFDQLKVRLKPILGFQPWDMHLYAQAFRHKSAVTLETHKKGHNERLEFLGDAILDAVVSKYLYNHFPTKNEGFLTSMRAKMVSRKHLNDLSIKMGLPELIDSKLTHASQGKSISGNALEALIGAVYLDRGYRITERFVLGKLLDDHVDMERVENYVISYKSKIIEWSQKNKEKISYVIVNEHGEQHDKMYVVQLMVSGKEEGVGEGSTIKEAEENASKKFYLSVTQ